VSRRNVTILVVIVTVTVVALVAAAVVLPLIERAPAIDSGAVSLWRETGPTHPARMEIRRDLVATGRIWYLVRYPAS
jgi:hypothetical protein